MPGSTIHSSTAPLRQLQTGFSLLELLVALGIIGMLALLAQPVYLDSLRKARRAEAHSALLRAMQQQELHYTRHHTYVAYAGMPPADTALIWFSGDRAETSAYQISATACRGQNLLSCVEVRAQPGGVLVDQRYHDNLCGMLTLNSRGERSANDQPLSEASHACR